ncbi:hypothetical protein I552_0148 [Mycobacterium xenopi 3993]|nr:hypothetical protein I552_0148 [Mycobacterium xenopi 3993]
MVVGVLVAVIAVAGVLVFSWKHQRFVPQDGAPDPQTRSAPSAGRRPERSTGTADFYSC